MSIIRKPFGDALMWGSSGAMGSFLLSKALVAADLIYSPTLFSSIAVTSAFVSFTPIGFVRGVSRYVKEDLVDSGTVSDAVRGSLSGSLSEYSSTQQIRDTIRDKDAMALFGVGTSSVVTRGLTSVFLPGSAVMAERVAEELERSKTSTSVTPESIASSAIEGLVIGSTEDKRDTFTMLFGGAFVLLTGGGFLFDYFVLRRAGEKIEKVKNKVNDKVEKVKESKDKFTSKIDENVEKVKESKDKLTNMIDDKVDKARKTKEKLRGIFKRD